MEIEITGPPGTRRSILIEKCNGLEVEVLPPPPGQALVIDSASGPLCVTSIPPPSYTDLERQRRASDRKREETRRREKHRRWAVGIAVVVFLVCLVPGERLHIGAGDDS